MSDDIRKNSIWGLLGNGVYALCQWLLVIIIARIGTSEMLGLFSLGMAVSAPIILLTNFQLRSLVASDVRDEATFGCYISFRIVCTIASWIIILLITLRSYSESERNVILLCSLAKGFESISDIIYGKMQISNKFNWLTISQILKGAIGLIGMIIGITFFDDIACGILGLAIGWFGILLFFDIVLISQMIGWKNVKPS